ncbi:MAG TPA: hypothetical protein VIN56_07295 [Candidatus Dormibacteraeota bacterium]|jgi:hypothetical protein
MRAGFTEFGTITDDEGSILVEYRRDIPLAEHCRDALYEGE